jgi:PEP-CTERM motif
MKISFRPMRVGLNTKWSVPLLALGLALILAPSSQATSLFQLNLTDPGSIAFPGDATGDAPGLLLADMTIGYSFTTTAGTTSGSIESAVYKESGGTLDFYYQVANCGSVVTLYCTGTPSATSIARETDTSFSSIPAGQLFTGYRTDGGSFPLLGTMFVNGTQAPQLDDRDGTGAVVGFTFGPADLTKIAPGEISNVLIIATDATVFSMGNASVIDGGTQTVAAFQPGVPEPGSMLLIGGGLLALAGIRRFRS